MIINSNSIVKYLIQKENGIIIQCASTNMTNNISTDLTNSASLNSDDGKKKIKNELL